MTHLNKDSSIDQMSIDQRINLLTHLNIMTPEIQKDREAIIDFCEHTRSSGETAIMVLDGAPFSGKTHTAKTLCNGTNLRQCAEKYTPNTVYHSISSFPSQASILRKILRELGVEKKDIPRASDQQADLIVEKLTANHTDLFIIDHVDTMLCRLNTISFEDLGLLAKIIEEAQLAAVLVVRDRFSKILTYHSSLDRMIKQWHKINTFAWNRLEKKRHFLKILDDLNRALPLREPSTLCKDKLSEAIFTVSDGLMGRIIPLVKFAAHLAIKRGVPCVNIELISEAYSRMSPANPPHGHLDSKALSQTVKSLSRYKPKAVIGINSLIKKSA